MTQKSILRSLLAVAASLPLLATSHVCGADAPLDIGSRRELFVDDALVEKLTGKAGLRLRFVMNDADVYAFQFSGQKDK